MLHQRLPALQPLEAQTAPAEMPPAGRGPGQGPSHVKQKKLVSVIQTEYSCFKSYASHKASPPNSARCLISITHTLPSHRCQVQRPRAPQPTLLSSPLTSTHPNSLPSTSPHPHLTSSVSRTHSSGVLQTSTSSPYPIPPL